MANSTNQINLSDYTHAGIYITEINSSVIASTPPQQAIINFIPGFSKTGTTFNRPILISQSTDRQTYFGNIDRNLEKNGSYFHRTLDIALQSGPIWAMNLLQTNSLDQLNYASVSVSAQYQNLPIATSQYDTFFNKAGFWQRDVNSFLFFASNTQQMIHFTNLSNKKITVFMFNSPVSGFNVNALTWYGNLDNIPTWISQYDFISDYMVRVIVVSGDWSNYATLAADPTWSKYFSASGLIQSQATAFTQDPGVTLLNQYDGSLIPYFVDKSGNNLFIETMINLDTDSTGLFCAYDTDNVETDYPNGRVDLIGQTLVGLDQSEINFMSYQDTIVDVDIYNETYLDTLGNVIGVGSISGVDGTRTSGNSNGIISGITLTTTGIATKTPALTINSTLGTVNINNTTQSIVTSTLTSTAIAIPGTQSTYRIDAIYVDQTGLVSIAQGSPFNFTSAQTEATVVAAGLTYPASMPNNAVVFGYFFRETTSGSTYSNTYVSVAVGQSTPVTTNITFGTFIPLTVGTLSTDDLQVQATATNVLNVIFYGTATATKANYLAYRRLQMFNELVTQLILADSVAVDNLGNKVDLTSAMFTNNYTAGAGNKQFSLTVAAGSNIYAAPAAGSMVFYYTDNEFAYSAAYATAPVGGLITRQSETSPSAPLNGYGVVAKLSNFYQDFYNGRVSSGDYFYVKNLAASTSITFVHFTDLTYPNSLGDYIIMSTADAASLGISIGGNSKTILISDHPVVDGYFVIGNGEDNTGVAFAPGLVDDGYLNAGFIAFQITNTTVTTYTLPSTVDVYDYNDVLYLKCYFVGNTLRVDFMSDSVLQTPGFIPAPYQSINTSLSVYTGEGALTETLEFALNNAFTITDTTFMIDAVRYPNVQVGDYVEAYVNLASLAPGQYPKKFARILQKQPWSLNATYGVNYMVITTDVKVQVNIYNSGMNYQTLYYVPVDDYITTYKAIPLNGFITQSTWWPNGTEAQQSTILDTIGKGTALFGAITNKQTFSFRYMVDSFGLGLTPFSKQQYADIAGQRKNCIAFISMPSVKYLSQSSNPSFINTDGTLNTLYLQQGGNLALNPPFLYSFAQGSGLTDGRSCVGYFFPYVNVNDNGRPLIFPPAVFCMNTYMQKNNSVVTGVYDWTVAAGTTNGLIQGIGNVEMPFSDTDLTNLYTMGCNPITYAANYGFYIQTEFTASLNPKSALSYLHVRELLIDLENDLYAMLYKYQWKFNTVAIRAKIKREADNICQTYVDRSGLYAFQNVIDASNNTPTLIDNQFGLLQTYIEPVKAMGIIVNQINVLATGQLANSSGFGLSQ